jgi:membrane-associated HD superfamily phosphohydrolase
VRHIEHQGILKKQKEDAQKKQAELVQKQAAEKAAAQAQAPVQRQVPRGPPVAATGPPPPKDAYIPPDPASNYLTIAQRQTVEAKAAQAQAKAAQAAKATATQPVAAPLTVAQQAAQRGQQSANKSAYIAAIEPILKDKFQGEHLATNTVQSVRTYLVGMSPRIPVEQLQAMTKEQLRGLVTQGSRMTRSRAPRTGGTRKNVTSSFRTTHRLLRQ